MPSISGHILTPDGWQDGHLHFEQTIVAIAPAAVPANAPYLAPGFIDVHVHGGGGHDTMDGAEAVLGLARFHAAHGTTALLPTTITNPWARVLAALAGVAEAMQQQAASASFCGATILGAHLEGPFISPKRLGAQPPFALAPAPALVEAALATGVLRVVTLAPEMLGATAAALRLAQAGVRISLGHSVASSEQTEALLATLHQAGAVVGGTHFYNAMGGLLGREPGLLGALLADHASWAELILDGQHVHATSSRILLHAKPNQVMLVTDAMRAAGLGTGSYDLGGQTAFVHEGVARLADGTLAGSVLMLDEAVRQAVALGLPLATALQMASRHPARYLGLTNRGELTPGFVADIVMLDGDLQVREVFVGGLRAE
jgi:N-acetylglucosamine-6-phosphate deacetylase